MTYKYFLESNNLTWKYVKKLNNKNAINDLEKKYNIKIPKDLKECIRKNNGGRPLPNICKVGNNNETDVRFLSLNKEDKDNIYNIINYFINKYDKKIIPFAMSSSGDYFCINEKENIVFYNHENERIVIISNNFKNFLDNLYE